MSPPVDATASGGPRVCAETLTIWLIDLGDQRTRTKIAACSAARARELAVAGHRQIAETSDGAIHPLPLMPPDQRSAVTFFLREAP